MDGIRVFLVGNTLFAESVARLLQASGAFCAVERFETLPVAVAPIQLSPPDVLILADVNITTFRGDTPFLPICPDIPVICTDSDSTYLKLITTTYITASLSNLVGTITTVKKAPIINGREVI
jgi:hypothetical protein